MTFWLKPLCVGLALAQPVAAAEFLPEWPNGTRLVFEQTSPERVTEMPTGPFADGKMQVIATEGNLRISVLTAPDTATPQGILRQLRDQLTDQGFETLYQCDTTACGGYDFRFGMEVIDEPDMRVDLRDFKFLSARKEEQGGFFYVSFLISKSPLKTYIQFSQTTPAGQVLQTVPALDLATETPVDAAESLPEITFSERGTMVLEGLSFSMGSANLGDDPQGSLPKLAEILTKNPKLSIFLVGHSDSLGSLDSNVALSKRRAQSVKKVLVQQYGIAEGRITSQGIGFLSPRATNTTKQGRALNRRVEVLFFPVK
jgi:OmpA-OmpF porin, OOP family